MFKSLFSSIGTQISLFKFSDALDIAVLTVILYCCYRFIKERRAGKLAIGIGFLVAAFLVSSMLQMNAVNFLFGNLFQVGILALLIVFQPEVRAGLEKVGENPLRPLFGRSGQKNVEDVTDTIDTVCDAVSDLSRSKTGALIVVERTTRLGEYIRSGVEIDANVNAYLLRNIFFDKSPLHDGAVIISDLRVCAAGCFLPLTQRIDINKNLGTRHRAAIGMSEVSDAIVIVVSEETGTVSCAIGGNLESGFNYRTLKQKLLVGLLHSNEEAEKNEKEEQK